MSKACWDYNTCYAAEDERLYKTWQDVCNRQLPSLQEQFYNVLRLECLVHALITKDSERQTAIDNCKSKGRLQYEASILANMSIPQCAAYDSSVRPVHVAASDPYCEAAKEPFSSMNMSGVEVYEDYWYSGFEAGNCISDCCFPSRRSEVVPPYIAPDSAYLLSR